MATNAPDHSAEHWVDAALLDDIPVGQGRVAALDISEVAVFRPSEQELYAVESRCPHDGQPLVQGRLEGSVLTCARHRHKFELKTGQCVRGDEAVVTYPVRIREGRVELCVSPPNAEAELERRTKSLKDALANGRLGQAARETVRLLRVGAEPARIALEIAAFDALHGEEGSSHALAVAADVLRLAKRFEGTAAALPLMHAADLALDHSKYRSPRKVPPSQDPGREADGVGLRLLALLEADDAEGADGLMRGALWRKWGREVIEPWFFELNSAHFMGFGHGLIYTIKAFELLEATGFEHARRILPGLTYALASMTREDQLPEWQWFRQRFAQLEPRLNELWSRQGQRSLDDEERRNATRAILDGSREEAWHAVIGALASGSRIESVIDLLSRAAAERLWRFDPAVDADPALINGWLNVTHPFTYAHALREAARRYRKPGLLKLVLYAVHMVNSQKPLDQPADRWLAVDAKGRVSFVDSERLLADLSDMIREKQPSEAQRAALAYLALGGSVEALRDSLAELVLRDFYACPNTTAHAIKLLVAACDEAMVLPDSDRVWPLRGMIRMLASPLRERSVEGAVISARRLVDEGLVPRSRT